MLLIPSALAVFFRGLSAAFQKGFNLVPAQWQKVATLVPSSSEANLFGFLGFFPKMREWVGERIYKSLQASSYSLTNKHFEVTIAVPADKIKDDTYGIFAPAIEMMGDSAARHPDEIVFGALAAGATSVCYDGQYFFDTDHPSVASGVAGTTSNYSSGSGNLWALLDTRRPLKPLIYQEREKIAFQSLTSPNDEHVFKNKEFLYGADGRDAAGYGFWQMAYGSKDTLNAANFETYFAAGMALKSDEDQPLGVRYNVCVVGPSNWAAARALFESPTLTGGAANPNYKMCEVIMSEYLT